MILFDKREYSQLALLGHCITIHFHIDNFAELDMLTILHPFSKKKNCKMSHKREKGYTLEPGRLW